MLNIGTIFTKNQPRK